MYFWHLSWGIEIEPDGDKALAEKTRKEDVAREETSFEEGKT